MLRPLRFAELNKFLKRAARKSMRIGIIQTRGLGDIVIAAPIAMYWLARGHEVFWPIDSEFLPPFTFALPGIHFLPVDKSITGINTADYFIEYPKKILTEHGCEDIHILYSSLTTYEFPHAHLASFLSFDRYKYAVAGVPFKEKWELKLQRNQEREKQLFELLSLSPEDRYIVMQETGSDFKANLVDKIRIDTPRLINIAPLTDNFLDWLGVIENAEEVHLIDSVYSNIVDQLGFTNKKFFYRRSQIQFTPIFSSAWHYVE